MANPFQPSKLIFNLFFNLLQAKTNFLPQLNPQFNLNLSRALTPNLNHISSSLHRIT